MMSAIWVERVVWDRMTDGIAYYVEKPIRYQEFLMDGGLSEDEAIQARQVFEEKPPTPIHGYARQGGEFPCWALVMGSESSGQDYLADEAWDTDEDEQPFLGEDGNAESQRERHWENRMDIYVYADHPDLCGYYYQLLKQVIVSGITYLQSHDIDEIKFSGAELAPDPRYMPADIFTRRFSITCTSDQVYVERLKPSTGPGKTVTGIHVDADEPDQDSGSEHNITTYFEEE